MALLRQNGEINEAVAMLSTAHHTKEETTVKIKVVSGISK
jgi:hypothetical protein